MGKEIFTTVVISLAVATASITISRSTLFWGFREWVKDVAEAHTPPDKINNFFSWFYDLIICPFCTSIWISLFVTLIYNPRLIDSEVLPLDVFVQALAIAALATFWGAIIFRAYHVERPNADNQIRNKEQEETNS